MSSDSGLSHIFKINLKSGWKSETFSLKEKNPSGLNQNPALRKMSTRAESRQPEEVSGCFTVVKVKLNSIKRCRSPSLDPKLSQP